MRIRCTKNRAKVIRTVARGKMTARELQILAPRRIRHLSLSDHVVPPMSRKLDRCMLLVTAEKMTPETERKRFKDYVRTPHH